MNNCDTELIDALQEYTENAFLGRDKLQELPNNGQLDTLYRAGLGGPGGSADIRNLKVGETMELQDLISTTDSVKHAVDFARYMEDNDMPIDHFMIFKNAKGKSIDVNEYLGYHNYFSEYEHILKKGTKIERLPDSYRKGYPVYRYRILSATGAPVAIVSIKGKEDEQL